MFNSRVTLPLRLQASSQAIMQIVNLVALSQQSLELALTKTKNSRQLIHDSSLLVSGLKILTLIRLDLHSAVAMVRRPKCLFILDLLTQQYMKNGILHAVSLIQNLIVKLNQLQLKLLSKEKLNLIIHKEKDIDQVPNQVDINLMHNYGMRHHGQQKRICTQTKFVQNIAIDLTNQNRFTR